MKKTNILLIGIFILFTSLNISAQNNSDYGISLKSGYNNGIGVRTEFTLFDIVRDTPFHLRFGFGYTNFNPGIASDARRIFINNATNGTPEKSGQTLDYRMDFLVPYKILNNSYINIGPRYSSFKGNFKYIGGNEDFDVTTSQWGIGIGAGNYFAINNRLDFEISVGVDYFFPATLKGHDTSYSPDDDNINARDDNENEDIEFTYKDADKAINQPKIMPNIMIGLNYKF